MVKKSIKQLRQIGLDFYEYLQETNQTSVTQKEKLKEIYNTEFRNRTADARDPNFGRVLFALKTSNLLQKSKRGSLHFHPEVQALYVDQWSSGRRQNPLDQREGAAPVVRTPSVAEYCSPDQAETGVRARRVLACELLKKLKIQRAEVTSDKHGIKITSEALFTDGKMTLHLESLCEYTVYLNIENTSNQTVNFIYYTALHWLQCFSLEDEHKVTKKTPLALNPGEHYDIKVKFNGNAIGFHPVTLAFEFKSDLKSSTSFHIVRFIEAHCMTTMGKELAPVVTYRPQALAVRTRAANFTIVDGQPPEGMSVMKLKHKVQLKPYPIPDFMNALIIALKQQTYYSDRRKDILEAALSWENYAEKFKLMLFLEELQMEVDIQRYNIPNDNQPEATMKKEKKLLVLEVPGVAENRPSVLRGDQLLAYPIGETNKKYRGYVHCVQLDSVKLGFSSELLDIFIEGMKFNIEFIINRLTLRIQHRAAEFAERSALAPVLFPVAPPSPASQQTLPDLKLFDRKLEKNPEQYRAVQHIVAGSSKPAPYLVFGPPGTGKTVTVVEAIKQIEKCKANCHILACAPSNSAADLLCKKIRDHVDVSSVFRMYASSHDPMLVPEEIKACSNLIGNCYEYPEKEKLMEYKIVVTTLITAGRLVSGDIPMGHFTHVFVDESGHAVETECIVPLAGLLHPETGQVVLAGDPKQLGPIIRSPLALKFGMGLSLLERLMTDLPLYQKTNGVFDNRFVTKLLRNYRSHPAILEIPNELFYDGELQACADEQRNFYCNWEYLPKMNFPVIFHGVTGLDTRESSSPSFFNIAEVEVLMDYVMKLLQTQGKKGLSTLSPKDIGIIAPYRKQVQKIRKALHIVEKKLKPSKDLGGLKVGSVEEFQGQERRVILVSTVRSSPDYVEIDKKFKLGFVKNEKRFNVAITRAKALLIIVGNPLVLRSDPTWARFLQYCQDQGGYRGYVQTEEDQDIVERCASLYLSMEVEVNTEESVVQQQLNPEWRHEM
ncbi:putative helicase mov-10-B.1 [Periophthalmus magnuspinnatus]|uniref:putative helicase mov-10-B.1 n=1 Tax=Periophthalmus magnuspinnatus TaxID=409849 RepID=UPI00145B8F80|nr:putative helicase mov-10-B.1 [Periophthalmus magnuspinnatus]